MISAQQASLLPQAVRRLKADIADAGKTLKHYKLPKPNEWVRSPDMGFQAGDVITMATKDELAQPDTLIGKIRRL